MLQQVKPKYYIVKAGQSIMDIAHAFHVSPWWLVKENHLTQEPFAGQVLRLPTYSGNVYTVQEGDTKELLCGSETAYLEKNGTSVFYLGMQVLL